MGQGGFWGKPPGWEHCSEAGRGMGKELWRGWSSSLGLWLCPAGDGTCPEGSVGTPAPTAAQGTHPGTAEGCGVL